MRSCAVGFSCTKDDVMCLSGAKAHCEPFKLEKGLNYNELIDKMVAVFIQFTCAYYTSLDGKMVRRLFVF